MFGLSQGCAAACVKYSMDVAGGHRTELSGKWLGRSFRDSISCGRAAALTAP